jgi:hypothetical protein
MEIIAQDGPVFLSDYETFLLLQEKRAEIKPSVQGKVDQNALTIEYETLAYFSDKNLSSVSAIKDPEHFKLLLEYLGTLKLTKFERLQIINSLPTNLIDFYVLVEECEERFPNGVIEFEILPQIASKIQ